MSRPVRIIFGVVLLVATGWSLAQAYPAQAAMRPPAPAQRDADHVPPCCRHCPPVKQGPTNKSNCPDGGKCLMMQCCRMMPTQAETCPLLRHGDSIARLELLPPLQPVALSDPADIFHPPRV